MKSTGLVGMGSTERTRLRVVTMEIEEVADGVVEEAIVVDGGGP